MITPALANTQCVTTRSTILDLNLELWFFKSLIKSGLKFGTIAEKMLIPVKELRWYNDKNLRRVWKIDNDCQQNKNKPSMS